MEKAIRWKMQLLQLCASWVLPRIDIAIQILSLEFDVVLNSPEGRCIGEAEGRDNRPIDINKMRQLQDNIFEDYSRRKITTHAKGILFGNAYRLKSPQERSDESFTRKCKKAAERTETALVRTCDLFWIVKSLVDNPDETFAKLCREAIFNTTGEVKFPSPPET